MGETKVRRSSRRRQAEPVIKRRQRSAPRLIAPLTSLRFFAAMAVVVFHTGATWAGNQPWVPWPVATFLRNGSLGVTFFFVLSGFILQHVYQGGFGHSIRFAQYMRARFARVYPVYLLAVLAMLPFATTFDKGIFAQFFLVQSWPPEAMPVFANWNGPAWTLSVEFAFYLLFPLISSAVRKVRTAALWLTVVVCAVLIGLFGEADGIFAFTWVQTLADRLPLPLVHLPTFVLGIATARLLARDRRPTRVVPAWAVALLILASLAFIRSGVVAMPVALGVAWLCAILANGVPSGFATALAHPWLVLLGAASYAIYLLQVPVKSVLDLVFGDTLVGDILLFPALIALGVAVFRWFEEPWRERIRHSARLPDASSARILRD